MRGVVNPPDIRLTTDRCSVVMVVEGRALITTPENRLDLGRGDTLVVPAAVGARTSVTADAGTVLITELAG